MALERQTSALPPVQPSYILRGHTSQIHSVRCVRQNSRLLTGDADGWIVYWKLETKRALAAWKAHDAAILGTEEWGRDKIITHGRDNSLRIWQLRASDEPALSTVLPAEDATTPRPKPWLLYTLPVNTLNFCAFSMCPDVLNASKSNANADDAMFVATPSTDDKKINVYQFPDEKLKWVVPNISITDSGMVMAVKLVRLPAPQILLVLSGYEGGLTAVHRLPPGNASSVQSAELVYLSQPHTQPILSLDVAPQADIYFTSSADSIVAAHRIPVLRSELHTDSTGMQGQRSNSNGSGLTPASNITSNLEITTPDALLPETVPLGDAELTSPALTPPTSDSPLSFSKQPVQPSLKTTSKPAGLSSLLSSAAAQPRPKSPSPRPPPTTMQPAYKTVNTKHSGQQSLRVRSDGRIFATGGWDTRIRIYSSKTLKEVAMLKWHKEGVYAVDFAQVLEASDLSKYNEDEAGNEDVAKRETGLGRLQKQREEAMQLKHWIVAGAKDGKVSLWEVF